MIAIRTVVWDKRNAACTARKARTLSLDWTTADILRSEHPCAMAMILILASPNAEKNRPAHPVVDDMPSPTAAMMEHGAFTSTLEIRCCSSSIRNSSSMTILAACACGAVVAKVMECSEEACDISTTLTPTRSKVPNKRFATPGTPIKPEPSTLTMAILSILEKAQTT